MKLLSGRNRCARSLNLSCARLRPIHSSRYLHDSVACGRERSGSPQPKSRALARDLGDGALADDFRTLGTSRSVVESLQSAFLLTNGPDLRWRIKVNGTPFRQKENSRRQARCEARTDCD